MNRYTDNQKPTDMIKRYHLPAILFFLICSSTLLYAQKSIYTFPFENTYRLPPMETIVDLDELSASYQTLGNLYTSEITGLDDESLEQISSMYVSDVKVTDAYRFLKFYMEEQLISPGEDPQGSVVMSIIYYDSRSKVNAGTVIDILTLGIGAFLGIPMSTGVTDVEVEATFYDNSNQILSVLRGIGSAKVLETLYNEKYSQRKQHQKALLKAIGNLNEKIMADPELVSMEIEAIL